MRTATQGNALEMSEEQERNINRALINEGPYRIRPECRRLIIPAEKWLGMSKEQKERKLKEFQNRPEDSVVESVWS